MVDGADVLLGGFVEGGCVMSVCCCIALNCCCGGIPGGGGP